MAITQPNYPIATSDLVTFIGTYADTVAANAQAAGAAAAEAVSVSTSQVGAHNGVATLDSTGNVPLSQLGNAPGGSVTGATVGSIALGSMGSSKTATATTAFVLVTGTLTANCALTVSGITQGGQMSLAIQQNSSGGHSLTVNGQAVVMNTAANSLSMLIVWYDGTNYYVCPLNT